MHSSENKWTADTKPDSEFGQFKSLLNRIAQKTYTTLSNQIIDLVGKLSKEETKNIAILMAENVRRDPVK